MAEKYELLPGTLDLLVLQVLSRGELHGWGITSRLEQLSKSALRVDEGSLYPSLDRMEDKDWIEAEWRMTENNRRAKYYRLTKAGRKQLEAEHRLWQRTSSIIGMVLEGA
jgi:transcriptional regulator